MKFHPRHHLNARFTGAVISCLWALLWCIIPASLAEEKADQPDKSSLQSQLQAALFAEEATRDLPAAAAAYEKLLTDYATQRQLAATALFRLAEVRRKQDQKDAAIKLYQQLLTEFPDTEPQARLSRENLTALGVKDIPAPGQLTAPAIPMDPDEERELNRLKTLLENGPDRLLEDFPAIPASSPGGPSTPAVPVLRNAASRGWKQVTTWLLDHGADPNKSDPLEAAASDGRTTICELLLTRGAKIETAKGSLAIAITKNYRETADWLMKNGADVNGIGSFGPEKPLGYFTGPPLLAAVVSENQVWVTRLLEANAKADIIADTSISALHAAAHLGKVAFVQQLLKAGADPNLADKGVAFNEYTKKAKGWSALHFGVKHPEIVKVLLAAGAKVDAEDEAKVRPLHLACSYGAVDSTKFLIAAGADVKLPAVVPNPSRNQPRFIPPQGVPGQPSNAPPDFVSSPLLLVALKLDPPAPDLIEILLKAGADVDQADDNGVTPLNQAIYFRQEKIALQLLAAGANPNIPSNRLNYYAYDSNARNKETTSLNLALGAAMSQASAAKYQEQQKNRNPNVILPGTPSSSDPPLIEFDPTATVLALLNAGAKADATDHSGMNPLHIWAQNVECPLGLGETLVKAGSPVDGQQKSDGLTPLHFPFSYEVSAEPREPQPGLPPPMQQEKRNPAPAIARNEFLLQHGANPDLLTKDGKRTMLSFATPQRRLAITRQRLYPKLAEDAGINLYWTDSGATHRIVVAPQKSDAPPLLAEAITHWSESFKDDKWKPDALQRLSIWRKREAGSLEEIPLKPDATELPTLHWGDVLEVTSLSEEHQKQEPKGLPLLRQMFRHLVRKVTVKLGDLSQEITLRGNLAVYDPTRPEAPLLRVTDLVRLLGGGRPEFMAGAVSLRHARVEGENKEVSWNADQVNSSLPEDGDVITMTAGKTVVLNQNQVTLMVPGRLVCWKLSSQPTLIQFLAELYGPHRTTFLLLPDLLTSDSTPSEISSRLNKLTADNIGASIFSSNRPPTDRPVLPWPDFAGIKIHRWKDGKELVFPEGRNLAMAAALTPESTPEEVRLADCMLMRGDIVELPLLNPEGKRWLGLEDTIIKLFQKRLNGKITVVDRTGRFTESNLTWVPPRWLDSPVGLIAVPDGEMSQGRVESVLGAAVAASVAPNEACESVERGKEKWNNTGFVLPGDTLRIRPKMTRVVVAPDGSISPADPVPQPRSTRRSVTLPHQDPSN